MYKMLTYSIKTWKNTVGVKVIKYNDKKWINEKNLKTALGCKNLVGNKTQYYSEEFEKRRYEIQDCEDFHPCRKFIAEELAVHLIIGTKTVKATDLKTKLGFNEIDPIMSKQESIGLRLKKTFSGEEIIEDFSVLNYLIDFYSLKYKLAVETDELGHADRDAVKEKERQTEIAEYLDCKFIRINPDKKDFGAYDGLGEIYKFFDKFEKREIKNLKKENKEFRKENEKLRKDKESLIGKIAKRLLELEFEKHNSITPKCLKWIVKKILSDNKE